ncbi:hypothetical protein IGI04_029967 [Brassica rapa subsp. trilocularis]|uniref:Uncharacterized protein n=1 Tax=Brassica rapa subsp. trilocularis TaxID=1813537 RepID=A0ABQ7LPB9_BRACM|nr:hypothetical protein IGI04_029967 [Brassica rapa subsp. trilocularis]
MATAEMENSLQFEIRDEKTWENLSRSGEEMSYREEDERLALKTETKETRERDCREERTKMFRERWCRSEEDR